MKCEGSSRCRRDAVRFYMRLSTGEVHGFCEQHCVVPLAHAVTRELTPEEAVAWEVHEK